MTVQKEDLKNHVDPSYHPLIPLSLLIKKSWHRISSFLSFLFSRNWVVVPEWNFASWFCASDDYNLTKLACVSAVCYTHRICHIHHFNLMAQAAVCTWRGHWDRSVGMLLSVASCPARQLTGLLRQCWAGSLEGRTHPWWPPTVLSSAGEGAALLTPQSSCPSLLVSAASSSGPSSLPVFLPSALITFSKRRPEGTVECRDCVEWSRMKQKGKYRPLPWF